MYFYKHLIKFEPVFTKLEEVKLKEQQRVYLGVLIDSTIHHTVLDLVLSNLGKEDKFVFIEMFKKDPGNIEVMEFLVGKIDNLEQMITEETDKLQIEFIKDLEEIKKNNIQ